MLYYYYYFFLRSKKKKKKQGTYLYFQIYVPDIELLMKCKKKKKKKKKNLKKNLYILLGFTKSKVFKSHQFLY